MIPSKQLKQSVIQWLHDVSVSVQDKANLTRLNL